MIKIWILEAAGNNALPELPAAESALLVTAIRNKYGDASEPSQRFLWDSLQRTSSRRRAQAWEEICEFVGSSPCLLLVDDRSPSAFQVSNGEVLEQILGDTPGFEFYVTNEDLDYLLCHNHHDFLIGWGSARLWVESKFDD